MVLQRKRPQGRTGDMIKQFTLICPNFSIAEAFCQTVIISLVFLELSFEWKFKYKVILENFQRKLIFGGMLQF